MDYTSNNTAALLQNAFNSDPNQVPNFLPFDLKSFFYSNASGNARVNHEESLRKLNNNVSQSMQSTQAIKDFIDAAYNTHPNTAGQQFNDNAVVGVLNAPDSWNTVTPVNTVIPQNFYIDVVGTTCRTCHIARTNSFIWFDTQSSFTGVPTYGYICGNGPATRLMPNSKVTYVNFWTSQAPVRSDEIRKFSVGTSAVPCPAPQ
jgi:hypothetical protein